MSARIAITAIVALLCGCYSSPELRVADDHFEHKRYRDARTMYGRALAYGIDDDDERRRAESRRLEIKKRIKEADLARKREALDQALQTIAKMSRVNDRVDALLWLLRQRDLSTQTKAQVMSRMESDFATMLQPSLELGTWLRALDVHQILSQDNSLGVLKRQDVLTAALGRHLTLLVQGSNGRAAVRWLQHMSQDQRWTQLPRRQSLATLRAKLAFRLYRPSMQRNSGNIAKQCASWRALSWSEPTLDSVMASSCHNATRKFLVALATKPDTKNPMRTKQLIGASAKVFPYSPGHVMMARNILLQLAKPWYDQARQAKNVLVRFFYRSIGDTISGQSSAQRLRQDVMASLKTFARPGINYDIQGPASCRRLINTLRKRQRGDKTSPIRALLKIGDCKHGYESKRWTTKTFYKGQNACYTNYSTNYKKCGVLTKNVYYRHERLCLVTRLSGKVALYFENKAVFSRSLTTINRRSCKSYSGWTPRSTLPIKRGNSSTSLANKRDEYFRRSFSYATNAARKLQSRYYNMQLAGMTTKIKSYQDASTPESSLSAAILQTYQQHIKAVGGDRDRVVSAAVPVGSALRAIAPPGSLAFFSTGQSTSIRFTQVKQMLADRQSRNKQSYDSHIKTLNRTNTNTFKQLRAQINRAARTPRSQRGRMALPPRVMWTSTGRNVQVYRGPVVEWSDGLSLAMQADFSFGPTAVALADAPTQSMAHLSLVLGALSFKGGYRMGFGAQSKGYTLGLSYIPSPEGRGGRSPQSTWAFGVTYDRLRLDSPNLDDAWSVRATIDYSLPLWDWLSLDATIAPDIFHLLDLTGAGTMSNDRAHMAMSRLSVGPTFYARRGRLFLHAGAGGAVGQNSNAVLWRTEAGFRF